MTAVVATPLEPHPEDLYDADHWYAQAEEAAQRVHPDPEHKDLLAELLEQADELACRRGRMGHRERARFMADLTRMEQPVRPLDQMPGRPTKTSARDRLLALVDTDYTVGRTEDERVYLVPRYGKNIALFSGQAKSDLARRYRDWCGAAPSRSALDEAWTIVIGLAEDAPKAALPLRMGSHNGALIIDIGDVTGRCIEGTVMGWRILNRSPITFRRSKAMLPLPTPERGGCLDELFELLPIAPMSRDLFAAWMVSTLFLELPHPAPVFRGEQGGGKSTVTRLVSRLIDPCMADTQKPPKTDDDWSHACSARWIVAVDNVSHVPEWWSDALCRTITGDGWIRRKLYEDDEVIATKWRRCVILNGISLGAALRPDLAERLIFFEVERPREYLTEAELNARLDEMRPRVLGALLDRAAAVLAALPTTPAVRDLRMADFAHLLAAHDAACGTAALAAYRRELDEAFEEAVAADPLASAVITFMTDRDEWTGTASQLLHVLDTHRPTGEGEYWPKTAHALSGAMIRSAPALRRLGIHWRKPVRSGHDRQRVARLFRADVDATEPKEWPW